MDNFETHWKIDCRQHPTEIIPSLLRVLTDLYNALFLSSRLGFTLIRHYTPTVHKSHHNYTVFLSSNHLRPSPSKEETFSAAFSILTTLPLRPKSSVVKGKDAALHGMPWLSLLVGKKICLVNGMKLESTNSLKSRRFAWRWIKVEREEVGWEEVRWGG